MPDSNTSAAQIAAAIDTLKSAINKYDSDKAGYSADLLKATNILTQLQGVKGVAPDPEVGG